MITQKMRFSTFALLLVLSLLLFSVGSAYAEAAPLSTHGSWQIVASPNLTRSNSLVAVNVLSARNGWAVGQAYQTPHSTMSQPFAEHWTGAQWDLVTSPDIHSSSDFLAVSAVSADDVWAVGFAGTRTLAERWDGSSWRIVGSPSVGQSDILEGVQALSTNNVWAVGVSNSHNGAVSKTLIEHWDGMSWTMVSSPNRGDGDDLHAIAALAPNDIWAVGDNDTSTALVEHWDGSQWHIVPTPSLGTYARLSSVSALAANNIWAVGFADTSSGYQTLVEHWDGSSWTIIPSPSPGLYDDMLSAITTVTAHDIWAAGSYKTAHHPLDNISFMLHWNGAKWSVIKAPNPGSYLYSLVGLAQVPGSGALWAVGNWQYHNTAAIKTLTELYS
jgi:hypothetical protein